MILYFRNTTTNDMVAYNPNNNVIVVINEQNNTIFRTIEYRGQTTFDYIELERTKKHYQKITQTFFIDRMNNILKKIEAFLLE